MSPACFIVSPIMSLIYLINKGNCTVKARHLIPQKKKRKKKVIKNTSCRLEKTQHDIPGEMVFRRSLLGVCYNLTSAGLDSTVMADMKLAVRDRETGRAVSLRPPIRKSPELLWPLSAQA